MQVSQLLRKMRTGEERQDLYLLPIFYKKWGVIL